MSYLNRLVARVVAWLRRAELDQDLDHELQTHLSFLIEENVRRGLSPEEARREARLRMGNIPSLREAHRETRGLPLIDTLLQDLRYTFRILRRDKGFAFFAILIVFSELLTKLVACIYKCLKHVEFVLQYPIIKFSFFCTCVYFQFSPFRF